MKLPSYQPDPSATTRYLFFTGKGGVGKTSISTATALKLTDAGKKVLLVSTDAAPNLDEMLGIELRNVPTPVPHAPGLLVLNIDPDRAAASYRHPSRAAAGPPPPLTPAPPRRRRHAAPPGWWRAAVSGRCGGAQASRRPAARTALHRPAAQCR